MTTTGNAYVDSFVCFMCNSTTATMFYWLVRTANEEQEEKKNVSPFCFVSTNAVYFGMFVCLAFISFWHAVSYIEILRFGISKHKHTHIHNILCLLYDALSHMHFSRFSNYTKNSIARTFQTPFSVSYTICALVIF